MTKRNPVTAPKNQWFNNQVVDDSDLTLEQIYQDTVTSGIINNHIGTGILKESLNDKVVFDSLLEPGILDGISILPQNQPSDPNLGNQLKITLTNSNVSRKRNVKIVLFGLDYLNNIIFESFIFKTNESQSTNKHFIKITSILVNDFIGESEKSLNLGGRLVITECDSFSLSKETKILSQDNQPNLLFRDLYFYDGVTLSQFLSTNLSVYDPTDLNIYTDELGTHILYANDIVTQYGQKFKSSFDNIQKISLLLSVRNTDDQNDLIWNGDLILSVYSLQSNISCPSDLVPSTPLDFMPNSQPLVQVNLTYDSLKSQGIILDGNAQPVDFIFSNTKLSNLNGLALGNYYAFTLKRSGAANKCDILISYGKHFVDDSRNILFSSDVWVDILDQDLWFQIYSDNAKVSSGQAYDGGLPIKLDKINEVGDYSLNNLSFYGNDLFRTRLTNTTKYLKEISNPQTGQPTHSQKEIVPEINMLNTLEFSDVNSVSDALVLGTIIDKNRKYFDALSSDFQSKLYANCIVGNEIWIKVVDDSTDDARFDTSVINLMSHLLSGDMLFGKVVPNASTPNLVYRISSAELLSMKYGDVNGDGIVDEKDIEVFNTINNFNLNISPPINSQITTDGYTTTVVNGYSSIKNSFSNEFGLSFQLIDTSGNVVSFGSDGTIIVDPNDGSIANFTSATETFNNIVGLSSYSLVILNGSENNNGSFKILGANVLTDVLSIKKFILNGETLGQLLRADINGDFVINDIDGYLLGKYVDREVLSSSPLTTYPSPSTNPYTKIGTNFSVIKLKLENFVDRSDDYCQDYNTRSSTIHPLPDILINDGYIANHNFLTSPLTIVFSKQLSWDESNVVCNSNPILVPTIFSDDALEKQSCTLDGIVVTSYTKQDDVLNKEINTFSPNNIIIGNGDIKRPDGSFYKVDFEVGTILLEIPDGFFGTEKTINIVDDFISNYTSNGLTRLGFPAMRFADCSYVESDAINKDQLRFSVSVQSFSPNLQASTSDGYEGVVVDGKMGVSIDYSTGLLTLNFSNLYEDDVLKTLKTKIQVNVFLKKGGFNNQPLVVDSKKVSNILKLINTFSSENETPSNLVDLENDVSGVLPIIHGGTGLNDVGPSGTVLVSNGSSLSYQFIGSLYGIPFSSGESDAGQIPYLDGYGKLDPSFLYKNPIFISCVSGSQSTIVNSPTPIGAFTFRFDSFIQQSLKDIRLEIILETTNASNAANVKLFDITNHVYIDLSGVNDYLSTTSITPILLRSDDIKTSLLEGDSDFVYEIRISTTTNDGTNAAICKMARLVLTYDNPQTETPLLRSNNFVPYLASPISS